MAEDLPGGPLARRIRLSRYGSIPWSCFARFAAAASLFRFSSSVAAVAIGRLLAGSIQPRSPGAASRSARLIRSWSFGLSRSTWNRSARRPWTPWSSSRSSCSVATGQVAETLQILDVRAVLQRLAGLAVDEGHLPGLGDALGRPLDQRLVDSLLHDLVPDVVGPVDVEPLLVEPEPDRQRRVLDQDQVRRLEWDREAVAQLMRATRHPARDHELPQTQVLQAEGVDAAVLQQRRADVDLIVDAVGLLLLEVVREHRLCGLLLELQVREMLSAMGGDALLEHPAPVVHGADAGVEAGPVGGDLLPDAGAERAEMIEEALHLRPQERDDARSRRSNSDHARSGRRGCRSGSQLVQGRPGRVSLALWTTALARRSCWSRSAWMARPRCVEDPRMSARPKSGYTPSKTIGSSSVTLLACHAVARRR